MQEPTTRISDSARPRLPRGVRLTHSEAQGGWVLLAPERVFKADNITVEILKRCTGEATLGAIVDDLAKTFSPRHPVQKLDGSILITEFQLQTTRYFLIDNPVFITFHNKGG